MAEYEARNEPMFNKRKRRFRSSTDEGERDRDRRPQRRRHEEPAHVKLRRQMLRLADSPHRRSEEEIPSIAKIVVEGSQEDHIHDLYIQLSLQMILEQPLKIPFVAGVALAINPQNLTIVSELMGKGATLLEHRLQQGLWREVKLLLRFFGCIHNILEGPGLFIVLESLFERAVELQTASSEDSMGLEIVKIILLTIPYIMATDAEPHKSRALSILDKTDVIASTPHVLYGTVNPYAVGGHNEKEPESIVGILQRQLQVEAENDWRLACIVRPWNPLQGFNAEDVPSEKHNMPVISVPTTISSGIKPRLPEVYFSIFSGQDIETVPATSQIASSLIRDILVDTINGLDFNRAIVSKSLIEIDCFFPESTFVKRATQYEKLRNLDDEQSTWKPEDVAVDAIFSQMLQLPAPPHKLVYYHAVLTEACKVAPTAIAPSLGRAIRYLYQHIGNLDLEVAFRFSDWFSHHLSNFGFTWKWAEWLDDVSLPTVHPKKSFMLGVLDKEIRLSFASRIRRTLPEQYRHLIGEAKEHETPPFKYDSDDMPCAEPARRLLQTLKTRGSKEEVQSNIDEIIQNPYALDEKGPVIRATDALVSALCFVGSKSLSHCFSQIERYKDRLQAFIDQTDAARQQILSSVLEYWQERPGIGLAIVERLLNQTILTPATIVDWVFVNSIGDGTILAESYVFELVLNALSRVTTLVRSTVLSHATDSPLDQSSGEKMTEERTNMNNLFVVIEDALTSAANGLNDAMMESNDQSPSTAADIQNWASRWLRVMKRRRAVEEAWVLEIMSQPRRPEVVPEDQTQMLSIDESVQNGTAIS